MEETKFQTMYEDIVICGQLPKHRDGSVDLHAIERFVREIGNSHDRVAVLRRLLEAKP